MVRDRLIQMFEIKLMHSWALNSLLIFKFDLFFLVFIFIGIKQTNVQNFKHVHKTRLKLLQKGREVNTQPCYLRVYC